MKARSIVLLCAGILLVCAGLDEMLRRDIGWRDIFAPLCAVVRLFRRQGR